MIEGLKRTLHTSFLSAVWGLKRSIIDWGLRLLGTTGFKIKRQLYPCRTN